MKELLRSDSICQSYAQMKKGLVFLTHSVYIIARAINEWQNDCGPVSMLTDSIQTRVITFNGAKHFTIPIKTLFKRFNLSVHEAA